MLGGTLGSFVVLEKLGEGGTGEVYRAHDARVPRDVALTLLPPRAGPEDGRARLLHEVRAAASLDHPNICTIYEVGEADGRSYIATELVDGQPLDRYIPEPGLPESEVFSLGLQIAEAVAHAHANGVLHRDLTTANIMITPAGCVKVRGFGLSTPLPHEDQPALTTEASSLATVPGLVTRTLAYIAPEQLRGAPATAASDVWALGIVLYEMAAGRRPFVGTTAVEIASAILQQSARPLPNTVPTILRGMIARCLAKEPSHRYQHAGELRAALDVVRPGHVPTPPPALGAIERAPSLIALPRPFRRLFTVVALVTLAILGLLLWRDIVPARTAVAPRIDSNAVVPLDNPSATADHLPGMHLVTRAGGTRADRERGLAMLQDAIDRDPDDAHAWAGLALGYVTLSQGPAAEADAWPRARTAALRAITLDPHLAEAHSALAEVRTYHEWDWSGAEESFRRASELNPNLALNHYHYSWYLALFSRWDEAITEYRRALELDPLTAQHSVPLGAIYLYQGRDDEAIAEAGKAIDFAASAPAAYIVLGKALANQGRRAEAEAAMQTAAAMNPSLALFELGVLNAERGKTAEARAILSTLEAQPPTPWSTWSLSQLHVALGDRDAAFKWLNHRPAHAFLPWTRVNPAFAPIRNDSRFAALMAEMRLPPP